MAQILYVDDDPDWRSNVERVLRHDHHVTAVGSYEDAVEQLGSAETCRYDLVIVDLNLSGRRDGQLLGEVLLEDLKGFRSRTIVMSGFIPGGPVVERARRWGVDEVIYKGLDGTPTSVRQTVARVLALGPRTPEGLAG